MSNTPERYHAICRPTFYFRHRSDSRGFNSPRVDIGLAFYCGFVLQLPRYFSETVLPRECMLEGEQPLEDGDGEVTFRLSISIITFASQVT